MESEAFYSLNSRESFIHSECKDKGQTLNAASHLSQPLEYFWFQLWLQRQAEQLSSLSFLKQANIPFTTDVTIDYYLEQKRQSGSPLFFEHARPYISYLKEAIGHKTKLRDLPLEMHSSLETDCNKEAYQMPLLVKLSTRLK